LSLVLIEWSSFEIAVFASSTLGTIDLDIMAIAQQILLLFFQVKKIVKRNWQVFLTVEQF
jgi:hypothetical protein